MQALDVFLGHSALCAHLVDEAGNEPDYRVCYVAVLRVLKPTLSVKALCHTASDAVNTCDTVKSRKVNPEWSGGGKPCVDRNGFGDTV